MQPEDQRGAGAPDNHIRPVFVDLGMHLAGAFAGVVLAHVTLFY